MARPLRQDPPGGRHHVMNRGARHSPIFRDADDRRCFLELIDDKAPRFHVEVQAFALMPDHFHLLLVSLGGRLSDFMSQLQGSYARHLKRQPGWEGPVWQGRFKSRLVTEETCWERLLATIHREPERAWLAGAAGGGSQPLPTASPVLVPGRTVEQALAEVCLVTGADPDQLFVYRRGVSNRAAWIAAWWLQEGAGQTQREVARIMGINQPGVAQRGQLLRKYGQTGELAEWMARLRLRGQGPPQGCEPGRGG